MKRLFIFTVFLFFAAQIVNAQKIEEVFSHLRPQHRQTLTKWLENQKNLRPATEKDAAWEELKAWRRENKNFQPYYAVGDFNRDGKEDFAVLLKVGSGNDSALVVFNAPFSDAKPAFFKKGLGKIQRLYVEYHKTEKMLYVTEYETHGFYLKPKGKTYVEYEPDGGD